MARTMNDQQPVASSSKMVYMRDTPYTAEPAVPFDYSSVSGGTPLIIDNGTSRIRAGFANQADPYLDEPNVIARYTSRKSTKVLLFGKDTEVDHTSRSNIRSAFDGDIMIGYDVFESVLDCTFNRLGISSSSVEHPVFMTETLANPLYCRAQTSELMFELYGVPSVCYGVDSLMAFSRTGKRDGLVVNLGHMSSSIIPVVDGKGLMNRAKRIPWGGSQASDLMLRLAQLKYPAFPLKVSASQATCMVRETAYFAQDYASEVEALADPAKMIEMDKIVQFEYVEPEVQTKSAEELEKQAERRREQGRKLQEMQAKQRAEKALQRELQLLELKELKESKSKLTPHQFEIALGNEEFDTEAELDKAIKTLETTVSKTKKSDLDLDGAEDETATFPLADVPDEDLDEEQRKEKRKQKMLRGSHLARMKLKAEKQAEKDRIAEEIRLEEESRIADPAAWAKKLKENHAAAIARMSERKKRRALLGDRKSAVAQNRMKSIANLASESPAGKKRKRGGGDDDGFGADDADWAVYRQIDGEEDSDAEADDLAQVHDIESKLLQFDSQFTAADTLEAQRNRQTALINAFLSGGTKPNSDDLAQSYQLHLNVERIRVPEVWFQPQIAGVDSAGLAEIAGWLLNGFDAETRRRQQQCIYVTGGASQIPGLVPRLQRELTSLLPFQEPFQIVTPYSNPPTLEPWRGMAAWSKTDDARQASVTRAEWQEKGGDYLKEHSWGNWADHGHEDV